jgi:hypothetical protein
VFQKLVRFGRKSPSEKWESTKATIRYGVFHPLRLKVNTALLNRGWRIPHVGNDRTTYVMGLFGSGRWYINRLLLYNIGERANYFRDTLHFHPTPTSMIYSGHASMRYARRMLYQPDATHGILGSVRSGSSDLIFVYRHPLDSLLTNWVWWRTYLRENRSILGISDVYKSFRDLCEDLSQNFSEFVAFANGDPKFFADSPGPPFLSFGEFVEETELFLQAATLPLRLEDFATDPLAGFIRIAGVMSVEVVLSRLRVAPPRTTPYGHLAVRDSVPQLRDFIEKVDALTKRRIERLGYYLG